MKTHWQEFLYRTLDGESLAEGELSVLRVALDDPGNRREAAQWLRFAEVLSDLHAAERSARSDGGSRDRLLAKAKLRQEGREALADAKPRKRPGWARSVTWLTAIAASLVFVVAGSYLLLSPDYPNARLWGDVQVLRNGQPLGHVALEPQRGDVVRTDEQPARLSLGGYCELTIDPHTEVSWQGAPKQEVVELRRGKISSRITPGAGGFRCRTPLGTLEVLGTEFVTEVKFPQETKGEAAVNNAAIVTVFVISGTVGFDMAGATGALAAGETKVFENLASGADRVADPRAAVQKAAESNEAAEELLALGPVVIPALREYIEQYPDSVNVSRQSRWEWRAARRCERILRLLEEQRLRETEGTGSDAAEPFIRATGLPAAKGRAAFEEALIPNRALMEAAAEAGGMNWDTLGKPERAAFHERFEAAFSPVAERWKKGVRLDAFANPAKPAYPMSDVVIGDLLSLLFARTQVPDAWTLDWYVDASRLLANWRDFEKTNPRLSRLELTLQEKDTALTAALESLIHKAAEKSETITGRTAAAWVALANRMEPMAMELAADIVAKDLPAFRQRERTAPDPASGKPIGRLEQSGPRLKLTTEANIQPGEYLVAARDGQFVSWLKLTKDGEHVARQTAHQRLKPQVGDVVLLPPDEALLPSEKDAALQTWFATVHILFSYGKTEEHARQLKQFVAVDGKVSVFSGKYRIRDFAMMGLLQWTGQDREKYETKTVPGVCPWSWPGGLKLLEFGEGEQWKAAQEMMDAWFDAHAAESQRGQEFPGAGRLSVEKVSNLKIGVSNAQFQLTTRRKDAQSDKHFHLIDSQILGDEDTTAKDGVHRVMPGPNTVFVIDAGGQLHGMGLNSRGSLGLSEEITASRDLRPIFDKPVRHVASHSHTLIVTQDGELWATGTNSHGQLGLGDTELRFTPQLVVDDGVTKAAAAKWFSMFLTKDGTLWAMGADMAQIAGVGETNPGGGASQYVEGRDIDRPVILARQVTDVAACGNLACLLKQDGSLWATGLSIPDKRLQRIADGPIRMAVGSAGVVLFVKENGSLWSIGAGWACTLGTGDKEPRSKPFQIEPKGVVDVSLYGNNAVYLKENGTAWGMGENRRADLGLGHNREVLKPERLSLDGRPTDSVADVWTVGAHTLILTEDGRLWGMGDNYYRQLQKDARYFNNPNQGLRRKYGLNEWPAVPVRLFKDRTVAQAGGNAACTLIVNDRGELWTVGWHPTVGMTRGLFELEGDQRLESRQPRRLTLPSAEPG